MKKSEIKFVVTLDKENIPEKIEWMAEDSLNPDLSDTKSISISLWDEKKITLCMLLLLVLLYKPIQTFRFRRYSIFDSLCL